MSRGYRLTHSEDELVLACPECDVAGGIYRRADEHEGRSSRNTPDDDECRCEKCGETFDEDDVVERPSRNARHSDGGRWTDEGQALRDMEPDEFDDLIADGGVVLPRVRTRSDGYERVRAWDPEEKRERYAFVHQLVAIANGDDPRDVFSGGLCHVHHVNGVEWDNRPSNLELVEDVDHGAHHARREQGPVMTDGGTDQADLRFNQLTEEQLQALLEGDTVRVPTSDVNAGVEGDLFVESTVLVSAPEERIDEDQDPNADVLGRQVRADGGVMLGTPPESSSSGSRSDAQYRATYRTGSGYDVAWLTDYSEVGGKLAATDVDGRRHLWTNGADVHIVEVDG